MSSKKAKMRIKKIRKFARQRAMARIQTEYGGIWINGILCESNDGEKISFNFGLWEQPKEKFYQFGFGK